MQHTGTDTIQAAGVWVIEPRARGLAPRLREVWQYRRLVRFFAARALAKLYRRTVLGKLWILIRPLFPLVVKALIFGGLLRVGSEGVPYFLFLVVGSMIWDLFSGSLTWATRSMELNRALLTRIYVPRLILPLAMMSPAFVVFAIHAGVLVVTIAYFWIRHGTLYVHSAPNLLWALLATALAIALSLSIGLFTSVLAAGARDVRFTLNYILDFWFFLTPVLYAHSSVPAKWHWLMLLNPMAAIVETYKFGLLGIGHVNPPGLAIAGAIIVIVAFLGLRFFGKVEADAVDRV